MSVLGALLVVAGVLVAGVVLRRDARLLRQDLAALRAAVEARQVEEPAALLLAERDEWRGIAERAQARAQERDQEAEAMVVALGEALGLESGDYRQMVSQVRALVDSAAVRS